MATVSVYQPKFRRIQEVVLLIIALAIGLGAYAATVIGRTGKVPTDLGIHALVLVAIAVVTHLLVRHFAPHADPVILPIAVALNGIGLAMIYRLDLSYRQLGEATVGPRQLLMTGVGIVLMAVTLIVIRDHRMLRRYTYSAMVLAIIALILPMLPVIGKSVNGSRVWINLYFATFQPSEVAKILLAVFFAGYLVTNRDTLALGGKKILGLRLPRARDLGPLLLVWVAAILVLVFQRDLGMSLLLFGLFVAMVYVATNRVSWIVLGMLLFLPAVYLATRLFPHVWARFDIWLNAFDPAVYDRAIGGSGQIVQGIFGMANGGLMGTGWGLGYPQIVPFANSDYIVASLAEELGLTGLLALLVMYLIFIERGMRTAIGVRDGFGKLLATGLAFIIGLQVFTVVGGITRIIPLTGLTTPFLAYGGSSLVSNWIILALILRISDAARRPVVPAEVTISTAEMEKILADEGVREPAQAGAEADTRPRPENASPAPEGDHETIQIQRLDPRPTDVKEAP